MFETTVDRAFNPPANSQNAGRLFAWLKGRERGILLVGVALQVVVLLGMILHHAMPLLFGESVLLRVVPVDPRDLLRGDYVILTYEFSRVPPEGIQGLGRDHYGHKGNQWRGRTVYVSLAVEPDGKHYRAEKFSIHRPTGGIYLRGKTAGWNRIEFGIESYYVQEGTGRKYEEAVRNKKLSAEVAVGSNGQARLRRLQIE